MLPFFRRTLSQRFREKSLLKKRAARTKFQNQTGTFQNHASLAKEVLFFWATKNFSFRKYGFHPFQGVYTYFLLENPKTIYAAYIYIYTLMYKYIYMYEYHAYLKFKVTIYYNNYNNIPQSLWYDLLNVSFSKCNGMRSILRPQLPHLRTAHSLTPLACYFFPLERLKHGT